MAQGAGSVDRGAGKDRCMALWTFAIQEQEVCFWGRYSEAESTARMYAQRYGLDSGTIALIDARGHQQRSVTTH